MDFSKLDYDRLVPPDSFGERPLPLVAELRFVESELHKYRKLARRGIRFTLPELPSGDGEQSKPQLIENKIAELVKMKSEAEKAVAWLEGIELGLSRKPGSSLLYTKLQKICGGAKE